VIESVENDIKVDDLKSSFAGGQFETYERLINLLWDEGRFEEAFQYNERARARAFLDQLAGGSVDFRAGTDAAILQKEHDLRADIGSLRTQLISLHSRPATGTDKNAIASIQSELDRREGQYTRLLTEIKIQSPKAASLVSVDVASLIEVQRLLDANTTLVEYFVTKDRILIFMITRNSFETASVDVDRRTLEDTITSFRDFASLDDPHPASLQKLDSWLMDPIRNRLKTSVVGIIPHGVLHYLPFAALTDGKQYLGQNYILFSLPSASVLSLLRKKTGPSSGTILALGNPLTNEPGLATLKFSEQEVDSISKLYGVRSLTGKGAAETVLYSQAGDATIVHLSAHGTYNPANPLFSAVYLAADSQNDGRLEVHEIYGMDLTRRTELVVLSACETSIGSVSSGDEVQGMARAFLYAGAPTVIASLWSVDDEATALFMQHFYTHLRAGMGKAQALQQAQNDLREEYPHPYYWAAFVLTGDAGKTLEMEALHQGPPVTKQRKDSDNRVAVGILGLLTMGVAALWLGRKKFRRTGQKK
jgi:CHAT domain-containing protein